MNKKNVILVILFIISGILYYLWASSQQTMSQLETTRIIDGDTIELSNNVKVRLLGINTPEKGMLNSQLPISYLNNTILNKEITLIHQDTDKYGRILGYVFLNNKNINQELIEHGYAHLYYYGKDQYYNQLKQSETQARNQELGIWHKSSNYHCLNLIELKYNDDKYGKETLTLENNCQKQIDITIKDDATHIYKRTLDTGIYQENFNHIFNQAGDSLYIWDNEGLVEFYRYE